MKNALPSHIFLFCLVKEGKEERTKELMGFKATCPYDMKLLNIFFAPSSSTHTQFCCCCGGPMGNCYFCRSFFWTVKKGKEKISFESQTNLMRRKRKKANKKFPEEENNDKF